jgi:hypothetical protein
MSEHTAENDALTERAEAALDAYFLGRIESEEQEPSPFGPRPIPPASTPGGAA